MKTTNIPKAKLLEVLLKNREQHMRDYLEAIKGYRDEITGWCRKQLATAETGKDIELHCCLQQPQDHTHEYDTIISMVEMGTDETIELDQHEFQKFVEDEWDWKETFKAVTSFYNAHK